MIKISVRVKVCRGVRGRAILYAGAGTRQPSMHETRSCGVWLRSCSRAWGFWLRSMPSIQRTAAMFSQFFRRHAAAGLYLASFVAALLSAASLVANAQEPGGMRLFKVVSPRDDIVVGIEAVQLGSGSTPEVQRFAALLQDKSPLTVWQYASRKDESGALVQAPLRQLTLFKNELLRVEPYSTPLAIKTPGAAK
jgi:hypothetical protein